MDVSVQALDNPSPIHGACHHYAIQWGSLPSEKVEIRFQEGALKEASPNGISIESLIAVCSDRLRGFQSGKFPCDENASALHHLTKAMSFLKQRTADRIKREVEGVHKA